jgi:molecular chaperone GrpE (heat shock protein)
MSIESERIAKLETQVEGIKEDVADVKADIKDLHSRLTTQGREIVQKIDGLQHCLDDKLDQNQVKAAEQHAEIRKSMTSDVEKITKRVDLLEKWRYMIVGGAIALGYAAGHSELVTKFFK